MIKSPVELKLLNLDLYKADGEYLYYQGIPEEYRFEKYSKETNKEFAIGIYIRVAKEAYDLGLVEYAYKKLQELKDQNVAKRPEFYKCLIKCCKKLNKNEELQWAEEELKNWDPDE